MRIYNDCLEMIKEVERDLFEMGIKVQSDTVQDKVVKGNEDYMTLELNGYDYKLTSFKKMKEMIDYVNIPWDWVLSEFGERIYPAFLNPGEAWKINKALWGQYIHDGVFSYTYNDRIREQLPMLIRELGLRPNTRQAIITIYDHHKDMMNWGSKGRVPCSMHYQFVNRNGQLQMLYTMRSCDFLKHFASDVALAILLLQHVSDQTKIPVGTFTHFIGSLHAFFGDLKERGIF